MKPMIARLLILVAVALFLGGGWYFDLRRTDGRTTLTGVFESQPTEVASRASGRVEQIAAVEGTALRAGQVVIRLEASPEQDEARAKEEAVNQARQSLREALNGPRREDVQKQQAVVAEGMADLARLNNGPRLEEIAESEAHYRQADAAYRKAAAGPRPQQVGEARAAAQSARARYVELLHGPTAEDRAAAKARLDSALTRETLADAEAKRYAPLLAEEAITRQQWDRVQADQGSAVAARREVEEEWKRTEEGTRPEQIEQARQSYRQAQYALALLLAGTQPEDIQAAAAGRDQAYDAVALVRRGSRPEDIRAAQERLAQAREGLAVLRAGTRPEQVAQLRAAVRSAAARAASAGATVAERTIRAPRAGVLDRLLVAPGDLVSAGEAVARLSDPTDIWVRVYVPESALALIRVSQDALIQADGVDGLLAGVVDSVSTQGEFTPANLQTPDERGKQVFGVRLRLKRPDPRVKAGMSVTVKQVGSWTP